MKAWLSLGTEVNGWQAVWLVDECGRALHSEAVCTIPVGFGHRWFAALLHNKSVDAPATPPTPSCDEWRKGMEASADADFRIPATESTDLLNDLGAERAGDKPGCGKRAITLQRNITKCLNSSAAGRM